LGSNIEPTANTLAAVTLLQQFVRLAAVSTFYWTPPIGRPEQPDYLNGVLLVETDLPPRRLNQDVLGSVERQLGRRRTADKFAARTMDLELILYGNRVIDEAGLRVPHPDLYRPFVGLPILELAPDLVLPGTCKSLAAALGVEPTGEATQGLVPGRPATDITAAIRERTRYEH